MTWQPGEPKIPEGLFNPDIQAFFNNAGYDDEVPEIKDDISITQLPSQRIGGPVVEQTVEVAL